MDNIVEKARALLNLANRGGTPAEAEAASAALQRLLLKHNMEIQDLGEAPEYHEVKIDLQGSQRELSWQRILYAVIARAHQCEVASLSRTKQVLLMGRKHNMEVVKELFKYLKYEVQTAGKMVAVTFTGTRMTPYMIKKSFQRGMIGGIEKKLSAQLKEFQEEGLLVLEEQEKVVEEMHQRHHVIHRRPSAQRVHHEAYVAGHQRGLSTKIHREVS